MRILVGIKRVVDHNIQIRVKEDGSGLELEHIRMSMNPFDEVALEAATQLKEKGHAREIIAVCVGAEQAKDVLYSALALGADRAILVQTPENIEPLAVAKILQKIARKEDIQLVLLGKQAIDDDCCQTGQMLGTLLGWAQKNFVHKIECISPTVIEVQWDGQDATQIVQLTLPAVVSVDLALAEPRFVSLPRLMKAKKQPIDVIPVEDFAVSSTPFVELLAIEAPATQRATIKFDTISQLVEKLKSEKLV